MNRKEAQERNSKIMQFRGTALRIRGLIPKDIWNEIDELDKSIILDAHKVYKRVTKILNKKIKCKHMYLEDYKLMVPKCNICGHIKYSRDGLGKPETF